MFVTSTRKTSFFAAILVAITCLATAVAAQPAATGSADKDSAGSSTSQPPAPTFEIWEIQVSGNTLLDRKQIESALTPHLGPAKTAEDVQLAADAIETLYRDTGYPTVFVDIPEQNVTSGIVRLNVTEGKISRVRISGADYFTPSSIREQLKSVQVNQSLYVPGIQQDINRVNTYAPDLRVVPVLKPGRFPGDVELEIKVDDKRPVHGSVELNNFNTATTTDTRMAASIGYHNLWQMGHSFSLQTQISPEDTNEVRVFAATYLVPAVDNDRIAFYVMKSDSEISAVDDVTVVGNGTIAGLRYVFPLASSARIVHSLSAGVDNKDFDEAVTQTGLDSSTTPISYNVWSLLYSSNFIAKKSTTNLGVEYAFGISGLGNDVKEFEAKRFNSRPNFSHLQIKYHRVDFFGDWQLHGKLNLHVANSPLISNEQFSAGGSSSVRGYYESEALGDNGLVWGVEGVTPMWMKPRDWLQNLQFAAFFEGAKLKYLQALSSQESSSELVSAGLGVRVEFWKGLQLNVDSGYPLRDAPDVDKGDVMTHAQVSWNF